jgi:kynureninase
MSHRTLDAAKLLTKLHERGVSADVRRPDVVRVAPAPLYTRFVDVVRFADILRDVVG